jgi:glycosyltransferase involved in cell wall biosynthesis
MLMKPIHVLDFRGTYKGGGGPDKTILNSAVLHDKEKVSVKVLYLRDPKDTEYQIDNWAASLNIDYIDVYDRFMIDYSCISTIKNYIRKHCIELLHAHDEKTLLYGWILRRMLPRLKIIYTCHLHSPYRRCDFSTYKEFLNFKLRRMISVLLMKGFDKPLLAVSNHTKQCMSMDCLNVNNIEVLHNGIDTDVWRLEKGRPVLREELNIEPDHLIIGTVARIAQQHKDLPTFYRVAKRIKRKIKNVKFIIVGDGQGEELANAKEQINELGLSDSFYFTGHRNDLLNVYASFDLFLMTSLTEGLPNTILEAMAMKVPIVSTSVAGVPELITHGVNGFLSPIRDVERLSQYCIQLIENQTLKSEFGERAVERIKKSFSFKERVKKMEDYYCRFAMMGDA